MKLLYWPSTPRTLFFSTLKLVLESGSGIQAAVNFGAKWLFRQNETY